MSLRDSRLEPEKESTVKRSFFEFEITTSPTKSMLFPEVCIACGCGDRAVLARLDVCVTATGLS